jgi:hypothetical protein
MTTIYDRVPAYSIEVGDQIIVDGDEIEVTDVHDTEDLDEIVVTGYSHVTGDTETYSLFADDSFDLWTV